MKIKRAMERHEEGEAIVIPIFIKTCDFKDMQSCKGYRKTPNQ
ncbi:MAG: hypothetical protein R2825_24585 [Saprospiraceae bacterium]